MAQSPATPFAQSFDEHVAHMVQNVLTDHDEYPTQSHFAWLHRLYSRVLLRTLELDRREADLARREAAFQRNGKKSRRGGNDGAGRGRDSVGVGADSSAA